MTYIASWFDDNREFCVSYEASNWSEAERIAKGRGWILMGELQEEVECSDEVEAMIEYYHSPTVH